MITSIESKLKAAYEHGRMDFLAGADCDPKIPSGFCSGLSELQIKIVKQSWVEGWHNESLMQALPDVSPA